MTLSKKLFEIDVIEAINRDSKRENPVGEKVIRDFYKKYFKKDKIKNESNRYYLKQNSLLPHCWIVDIDGTTALMKDRSPYDYSKVSEDVINKPMVDFINKYLSNDPENLVINFVTGRNNNALFDSISWLRKNIYMINDPHVKWNIFIRKPDDSRADDIVKTEIFNNFIKDKYYVEAVFDDRNRVVKAWRDLGLLTFQVYDGDF